MKLTAQQKLKILNKVLKEGKSVTSVCAEAGIARKTFYQWKKKYQQAPNRVKKQALKPNYASGKNHPKNKRYKFEDRLISIVIHHPSWGSRKISAILCKRGLKLSNHAVYSLLKDLNLATKEKREEFSSLYQTFAKIEKIYFPKPLRLTPESRKRIIEEVVIGKEPVVDVCQRYHVSRKTFYKWLARYREAREKELVLLRAMEDNYVEGFAHPRSISEKVQEKILNIVKQHPEYSTHKVGQILAEVSNHGVQNVFQRLDLNTYEKRLAYVQAYQPITPIIQLGEAVKRFIGKIPVISAIPPPAREKIASVFRPFVFSLLSSVTLSTIFIYWLRMISQAPTLGAKLGLFFASVALLVGGFFFAYSMKYYLTLAIVLSFSRQPLEEGGGYAVSLNGRLNNNQRNGNGWLSRIFGLVNGNGRVQREGERREIIQAGGLQPSLDHIKLKRYPFVSIHLPFYNEKKVVERILKACTAMDYPNFEIIICDDSTDETTDIVQRYAKKHNQSHPNAPKIKVLHRPTRQGFKGGALAYALKHTDPKTEFVVVFDADFIPYPDTLELFIKYFKANNQGSEDYAKSHIAVVGGYQWHVLNKSENWITRGVRAEYAGSYVIERPGREILGLLKQISGSVYMIRADLLKKIGWGTSITEDFQLTLKLYEQGYKVIYTPYIQAPAECVSTLKRLVRQRMRWAEGHSNNVRKMFIRLMTSPKLTLSEKLEVFYLSPYYLQATFFLIGTFSWLLAETVFPARLPFWTSLWGWSLVLTNLLSLPLMNTVGLFLEESEERDYLGLLSFVALSYILVPFQAYASVKGFLEKEEGPWFRTPKTGKITDIFTRGRFYRWISGILPGRRPAIAASMRPLPAPAYAYLKNPYVALSTANNRFNKFQIKRRRRWKWTSKSALALLLVGVMLLNYLSFFAPNRPAFAQAQPTIEQQINIIDQEYSTTSSVDSPSDNSLGIVRWTAGSYTGASVYFEAVFKGSAYERKRTSVSLTDGTDYTVRIKYTCNYMEPDGWWTTSYVYLYTVGESSVATLSLTSGYGASCAWGSTSIKAARLIIVQTDATMIDDTETQVEVGDNDSTTSTGMTSLSDPKIYMYDNDKFSGTVNAYFEATLKSSTVTAGSVYRFDGYDTGEAWPTNPEYMVDASWDTFASADADGQIQLCNSNAYTGGHSETITKVVLRTYGRTSNNGRTGLRAVYGGTADGDTNWWEPGVSADWSPSYDITTHANAPDPWTWTDIQNLDVDVEMDRVGGPDTNYVGWVEVRVTYESGVGTAYAELYNRTDGAAVTNSEVSVNSTSWTRVRGASALSTNWDTTNDDEYLVRIRTSTSNATAYIANAKIILTQDAGGSGITNLETVHQYVNSKQSLSQTGTMAYARLAIAGGAAVSGSTVSTTSTSYDRQESGSITPSTNTYDTEISLDNSTYTQQDFDNKYDSANWDAGTFTYTFEATLRTPSANNMDISNSWLIIEVTSLQIPEKVIFLIPLVIFLPKMVEWLRKKYAMIGVK